MLQFCKYGEGVLALNVGLPTYFSPRLPHRMAKVTKDRVGLLNRAAYGSGVPAPDPASPPSERADNSLPDQIQALMHVPALQLIYDTAPIGLAFLSRDCRYLQINQRLTE